MKKLPVRHGKRYLKQLHIKPLSNIMRICGRVARRSHLIMWRENKEDLKTQEDNGVHSRYKAIETSTRHLKVREQGTEMKFNSIDP